MKNINLLYSLSVFGFLFISCEQESVNTKQYSNELKNIKVSLENFNDGSIAKTTSGKNIERKSLNSTYVPGQRMLEANQNPCEDTDILKNGLVFPERTDTWQSSDGSQVTGKYKEVYFFDALSDCNALFGTESSSEENQKLSFRINQSVEMSTGTRYEGADNITIATNSFSLKGLGIMSNNGININMSLEISESKTDFVTLFELDFEINSELYNVILDFSKLGEGQNPESVFFPLVRKSDGEQIGYVQPTETFIKVFDLEKNEILI